MLPLASCSLPADSLMAVVDLSAGALQKPTHAAVAAAAADFHTGHMTAGKKRGDLLQFVDQKDVGTVEEYLEFVKDPYLHRYAQPEHTKVTISERKEDLQYPSYDEALRGDENVAQIVAKLAAAVSTRLRYPMRVSLDSIYAMYAALPEPRMIHIPAKLRHHLLRAFGTPKKKESQTMLRYFSLIGDVKDCGIALRRSQWNHALALAARYVGKTTDTEAESALQLWREMEKMSGVKGNSVTFNILFDAASKAGNFTLADMLFKEMRSRKMHFNRFHRVSLIHFFGLQGDADGVRAAYRETVEQGEMVDTVVLNCVITSFLRCGEDAAALKVYQHMKASHSKASSLPTTSYKMDRAVTKVLTMFAEIGRKHPELRRQLQDATQRTPDIRTYRILVNHFALQQGNLGKVAQFLDEMRWFEVPIHGSIFLTLFEAFTKYGGFSSSDWSPERLEGVLSALLHAIDDKVQGLHLDTWLMIWALRAFMKCTNRERVLDVYDDFQKRWNLAPDRAQFMEQYVARLLSGKGLTVQKELSSTRTKAKAVKEQPV
ncbi:Pentatricopeptide repeat-containing protein, mitochondrial [Colletotrichum chlorophyti]|uniref:Pentatricopeptide repeat-containing protein, mitochondrial n=1 Tax=Colletotrichum chlorophyti TaxID=708187 RepID=A0A1Q8RS88_9PEZI|nr:Pentatricopeptide repeat-containing protein, mitochondrial [Colletotrichum chlorophyti]